MLIDYIYLVLILVLIGSILFFIYLSYEYRHNNSMQNDTEITEGFINPQIIQSPYIKQSNDNINAYLKNYNKLFTNTYNQQIINDTNSYQKLKEQTLSNKNDSAILLQKQTGLQPPPETFPSNQLIKTIKSMYNSQYLSLFPNDINKYGILVNDKCMTINGLCKDEYCLQNCQNSLYTTDTQKFYTNRISSVNDVARIMKIPIDKVNPKNIYPFNVFQSSVNDKCLHIDNLGISIDKCNLNDIKQQWAISPNENICILT